MVRGDGRGADVESTGTLTVRICDELDLATVPQLRCSVEQALRQRPSTVAVDLSACPFAGVDAVQVLVLLTAQARRQGTTLVLLGLQPIVRRVIDLLGVESRLLYGGPPRSRAGALR